MGLFGDDSDKKVNIQQQIRQNKNTIDRTIREIDNAIQQMQIEEKKQKAEVRKALKDQQPTSAKILAKNIVRVRNSITRMHQMRSNMVGLQLRVVTVGSAQQMLECMKGVGAVLKNMNQNMKVQDSNQIMQDFMKENDIIGMNMEIIDQEFANMFPDEGEDDSDEIVNQIIAEIQIEDQQKAAPIPGRITPPNAGQITPPNAQANQLPFVPDSGNVDKDLEERLNQLRRT
ncbi:MAG: putative SNF7 family protein [Streblomastix strix]|uniref:Putative SNF7 family protein n=1 Tax=Streblomastix strix TaxID=222440 RepID=A0A5J4UGC7_9EUKA|nr:MAG: putative SNF7 family protein [Streblomastix strix]